MRGGTATYTWGKKTFRGVKTPLLHALAQADVVPTLWVYVVCTRRFFRSFGCHHDPVVLFSIRTAVLPPPRTGQKAQF